LADPSQTNDQIAKLAQVDHYKTVRRIRQELENANEIPVLENRHRETTGSVDQSQSKPKLTPWEKERRAKVREAWNGRPANTPRKLPRFTENEIDPTFEQDLREKLGREPTDEDRSTAWHRKHGHVQVRNYEQRMAAERLRKETEWIGLLSNQAKALAPLLTLTQDQEMSDILDALQSRPVGPRKLQKARDGYMLLVEVVEALRPFFESASSLSNVVPMPRSLN
jgi:hypothetical protein